MGDLPNVARISNDDLAPMLYGLSKAGATFTKESGATLHRLRIAMLTTLLEDPAIHHIYIDNTNLSLRTVKSLYEVTRRLGAEFVVNDDFLSVSVEECIRRDAERESPVGEDVIRKMAKQAKLLKPWTNGDEPDIQPYDNKQRLPEVIICDIDGTIARMVSRGPYELDKVRTDKPIRAVTDLLHSLYEEQDIIFLSGRSEESRAATETWLERNLLVGRAQGLYMRAEGDNRPDWIVKHEMFQEHIAGKYKVRFVLDDRDQVIHLWRRQLMLPTFQVADGNF
jgi:predicted kinase